MQVDLHDPSTLSSEAFRHRRWGRQGSALHHVARICSCRGLRVDFAAKDLGFGGSGFRVSGTFTHVIKTEKQEQKNILYVHYIHVHPSIHPCIVDCMHCIVENACTQTPPPNNALRTGHTTPEHLKPWTSLTPKKPTPSSRELHI